MPVSFDQLTARAQTIRDEYMEGANTSLRVGALLSDIIDSLRHTTQRGDGLADRLAQAEKACADVAKALATLRSETEATLATLQEELTALRYNAVVFSPSTVPTMAVMRWADILAYNEDTTPEVAARYLEPLWEGLLEACMGSTTAAVYAEGNNSYAPQEGILVPATRTERIRMVPVSASSNRTALGDTATLNLRYAHLAKVWNLTIVRTAGKGDAVTYRVTRQEVPTGSGSGQPVEPGDDVMQRLTRLEASLTL